MSKIQDKIRESTEMIMQKVKCYKCHIERNLKWICIQISPETTSVVIPLQCLLRWRQCMKLCPRRGRSCRKSGKLTTSTSLKPLRYDSRWTCHLNSLGHIPFWALMAVFLCSSFSFLRRQPAAARHSSHGPPSVADSAAEYFDASDILCGSSSEVSDESGLSDGSTTNSEPEEGHGGYM